mgnify:CR=1 FL=1
MDNRHSCLESHPLAVLHALERLIAGEQQKLPSETHLMNQLPRPGLAANLPRLIAAGLGLESTIAPIGRVEANAPCG